MVFDCVTLTVDLTSMLFQRHWGHSPRYTFGYSTMQVLTSFANAVFLVFVSFFVFSEMFSRLADPPVIGRYDSTRMALDRARCLVLIRVTASG